MPITLTPAQQSQSNTLSPRRQAPQARTTITTKPNQNHELYDRAAVKRSRSPSRCPSLARNASHNPNEVVTATTATRMKTRPGGPGNQPIKPATEKLNMPTLPDTKPPPCVCGTCVQTI